MRAVNETANTAAAARSKRLVLGLAVATPWPKTKRLLRAAAAVFAVSLTARTLDFAICADYPHGSHWLWHLGNGVVIFLAIKATLVRVRANFHT